MAKFDLKESLIIEFKSDVKGLSDREIVDAVVAFANTDGGDLYLGIEDDGEITGLNENHLNFTQLSAFIANKTVPPISVRTELLELEYPVLKISVPRSTTVVASSTGKIQRRRLKADGSPENTPMYPYEIATRLSSLSLLDYSAQPVPEATYNDLDPIERERLRNIIRNYRGEMSLLELTDEELDKALQLVVSHNDTLVPTFCGLLLIGKREALMRHMPTAEASFQVLTGTDIKVNESFKLPILAVFDKIMEYFNAWNQSAEMEVGLFRITIPDFEQRAFREALVNAFCHRDYSVLGRVLIQITDAGLIINNPGGFIEGITAENLLDAEPHGRNPALADAMKRIGLAERTGRGIDRIYEGSLVYGRLVPDYSQSNSISVKLFIPKGPTDKAFIEMLSAEQQRAGKPFPIYSLMILNALKNASRLNIRDLEKELGISSSRIRVTVESLVESGIVEAGGNGRGRYYLLSSKYYKKTKNEITYIRKKDIDSVRYRELVMNLAKEMMIVSRADVIELLRITPSQAYRLLKGLAEDGKLCPIGKGAGAKYVFVKENS